MNDQPNNLIEKYEKDMRFYKLSGIVIFIFFCIVSLIVPFMFEGRVWYLFPVPLLLGGIYYLVSLFAVKMFKKELLRLKEKKGNHNENK